MYATQRSCCFADFHQNSKTCRHPCESSSASWSLKERAHTGWWWMIPPPTPHHHNPCRLFHILFYWLFQVVNKSRKSVLKTSLFSGHLIIICTGYCFFLFPFSPLVIYPISHLPKLLSPNPPSQHCKREIWAINRLLLWKLKAGKWDLFSAWNGIFASCCCKTSKATNSQCSSPASNCKFKTWRTCDITGTSIILELPWWRGRESRSHLA